MPTNSDYGDGAGHKYTLQSAGNVKVKQVKTAGQPSQTQVHRLLDEVQRSPQKLETGDMDTHGELEEAYAVLENI